MEICLFVPSLIFIYIIMYVCARGVYVFTMCECMYACVREKDNECVCVEFVLEM